jgi:RNAse (barnase) inhibitor barstar
MINTSVTLYWQPAILEDTIDWLRSRGYQVVRLDASGWGSAAGMHRDIASAFDFPGYYGRNLDALNDCMRDVVAQDYGWLPDTTGLVVVFDNFDAFARSDVRTAQVVLDILRSP